jgi:putative thioredoxin
VRDATDATFTQVLDLSSTVPVVVEFYGQGIEPALAGLIEQYGGRIGLATVDATANPQLVQAFQVQEVPTVAAVVGGRPIQLFSGILAEKELRDVLDQLLQLAAQNGVTGTLTVAEPGEAPEPVEEPLPPHHQEAYDAITAGDFATAIKEYETAIAKNPRDQLAIAGLAQVSLLARLEGKTADEVRSAAASNPTDPDAQLAVADLDVSGGHLDDAFARLLDLYPSLDVAGKNAVRTRLLEYFEIAGAEDPRVIAARRRLTGLLY